MYVLESYMLVRGNEVWGRSGGVAGTGTWVGGYLVEISTDKKYLDLCKQFPPLYF